MKAKPILNYITSDTWWDTDVTLLPELCQHFDINMFVADGLEHQKYPQKDNFPFKRLVRYKPRFHNWDPRKAIDSLPFCWQVIRACLKKDTHNFFILGSDPYLLVLLCFFLAPKRTVIAAHNYQEHVDGRKSGFARVNRWYYHRFHHFLFFSPLQKNNFLKDFPNKQAYHINMPLKDFGQPTQQRTDNRPTFLFFGAIRDYKRPDLFIQMAHCVAPTSKVRFIMAGKALHWEKYAPLIARPECIELHIHFIDNADIPNYFAQADFLVLPYTDATQSGPSLIAINYGVPIIATQQPAFEAIIQNGQTGYLFPPGDENALFQIIERIIEQGPDNIARMKANMAKFRKLYMRSTQVMPIFKKLFLEA